MKSLRCRVPFLLRSFSRSEQRPRVRWGKRTGEPSAAGAHGASRSEQRLRVRWGKRTGEPSVAGAHGGEQRQWVPGSAQFSVGPRRQYRGPGPERNQQGGPAQPGPAESSQTRRRAAADQVSHRAASEPAVFPGNGRHEVWAAGRRGASQAARLQGNAGNAAHADAGDGPGRDSKTLSGWARIPEGVPRREIGT